VNRIEPAGIKDLKVLNRLEKVCFDEDRWPIWDLFSVLTVSDMVRLKAVDESGNMLGFIAGDVRESKRYGWIVTLGVFPQYRRQHIASALLEACEKQMNRDRVRLCVRRSNLGAMALYENHGYMLADVWKKYYVGGEDALVLEKILT